MPHSVQLKMKVIKKEKKKNLLKKVFKFLALAAAINHASQKLQETSKFWVTTLKDYPPVA